MAHRVISADTVAVKPAQASGTQEYFTDDGPGTLMPASWCNMVQDEIVFALSLLGISPDPADDTQLMQLLEASVSNVGGASNVANPAAVTTPWRRAVIASDDSIAGRNDAGALSCVVAASDNSRAREARTFIGGSIDVQVNGSTSAALAVIGFDAGSPADIIEATAEGSAFVACELAPYLECDSKSNFGAGSRGVALKADRACAIGADEAIIWGGTSLVAASKYVNIGVALGPTLCAVLASSGRSGSPLLVGTSAIDCAAMLAVKDVSATSDIDSSASALIAAGDSSIAAGSERSAVIAASGSTINTSSPRSAIMACGGGDITAQEAVLLAGNGNEINNSAYHSSIIGGADNLLRKRNSHMIGCDESEVDSAGREACVMLASYRVDSGFSAAGNNYNVMGGVNVGAGAPKWRIDSTAGQFRGTLGATTGGLDYAEYFENGDGVAHGPGRLVSRVGRKVVIGQPGMKPLGPVSTTPSFVGGDDDHGWSRQHATDEWGRPLWDTVETARGPVTVMRRNPEYNPELAKAHKPRSQRPDEWTLVGLVGQVRVAVSADVAPDDYLECGKDGIGCPSALRETGLEVMDILAPYDPAKGYAIALVLVR